jgi:hypothetical protein
LWSRIEASVEFALKGERLKDGGPCSLWQPEIQEVRYRSMKAFGQRRSPLGCWSGSVWSLWIPFLVLALGGSHRDGTAAETSVGLENAAVLTAPNSSNLQSKAVQVLVEEVEKRALQRWNVVQEWPEETTPVIVVGSAETLDAVAGSFKDRLGDSSNSKAEGYRILVFKEGRAAPTVFVIGNDDRGVLFGCGRLLLEMKLIPGSARLEEGLAIETSPAYSLRGHQLGYRPKTNSYDAWTASMWDQYIRELALFGTNAIELIPPRSDDDDLSPHFPLPKIDMMAKMSQIVDDYGLDVWIWYPAMDEDYSKPDTVEFALKEWEEVYKALPRIDVIFVPGGDPGHTQPVHLMNLLEKQTEVLQNHHPEAEMWVSPQSFTQDWMDEFIGILTKEKPEWLSGIVFGPQNRIGLPELRRLVPEQYPIRRYPDITHSLRNQYVVQEWDLAYALTENREVINPRPVDQKKFFHIWEKEAVGFLTYSEGCNDDINKIIWSGLGWDPNLEVDEILRLYSRFFIGVEYEDIFAQGILALERNWRGPLATNESVYTTLKQFQAMEKMASPQVLLDWRFQQGLFRAYYDAFVRRRLIYETELEEAAMEALAEAPVLGSRFAIDRAEDILNRAVTDRAGKAWRARVFELAEALYQSARMQLSVDRYQAISVDRGAHLDLVDRALNNRDWLNERFSEIRAMDSESTRLKAIAEILNWTDPGPGGFYDDLGNPTRQGRLVRGPGPETDPEYRESSQVGFRERPGFRLSWMRLGETRYDQPLRMRYDHLDPNARYKLQVVYAGDTGGNTHTQVRLDADEEIEVHPYIEKPFPPERLEFEVPHEATKDGELTLKWTPELGRGGSGRGCQIAEVWLIRASD